MVNKTLNIFVIPNHTISQWLFYIVLCLVRESENKLKFLRKWHWKKICLKTATGHKNKTNNDFAYFLKTIKINLFTRKTRSSTTFLIHNINILISSDFCIFNKSHVPFFFLVNDLHSFTHGSAIKNSLKEWLNSTKKNENVNLYFINDIKIKREKLIMRYFFINFHLFMS